MAEVEWSEEGQGLVFGRRWTVFPGTDAVVTRACIRSESVPQAMDCWEKAFGNVVETLPIALGGWRVRSVSFFGRTDLHNEYVRETEADISAEGGEEVVLPGNLLILEHPEGGGIFVLHESPPEDERRPEVQGTFRVSARGVRVMGWGVRPEDICPGRARWSYPVAVGIFMPGEALPAIRRFLKARFPFKSLDGAVVANPWGDGHCYEKFREQFVVEELAASGDLGATHYQIDDGWQAGGILADLTCGNLARGQAYWEVDREKFPDGFGPLASAARQHGVGLALWFCPDVARGYRNWEDDRDILLGMHRRYGIDLIKLDGVRIYTKDAEEGLTALLEGVVADSGGRIRFNMDVTNGLRLGYFGSMRFGTVFVENRYVTGKPSAERRYYPWRVLRNLWRLSRYVPPERLQFEFANLGEAAVNDAIGWDRTSLLTPFNCSWEYIAAIPMMAAPLCWLEPSSLPGEVLDRVRPVLELHRSLVTELAEGYTFPIGEEPSGHSWTGFDCVNPDDSTRGILAVYREDADSEHAALSLSGNRQGPGAIHLTCLSHEEQQVTAALTGAGAVPFTIPARNDFRVYRYRLELS